MKTYIILRDMQPHCDHGNTLEYPLKRITTSVSSMGCKVFYAGHQDDVRNRSHHGVVLAVKATRKSPGEDS